MGSFMKCPSCKSGLSFSYRDSFKATIFKCADCNADYDIRFKSVWTTILMYLIIIAIFAVLIFWCKGKWGAGFYTWVTVLSFAAFITFSIVQLMIKYGVTSKIYER